MNWSITLVALVLFLQSFACASDTKQTPAKALVITGGCCHDWDNLAPIFADILRQTGDFEVTVTKDRNALLEPEIKQFDVVLFYSQGGDVIPAQIAGLTGFVRRGGGFVGLHAATATFKPSMEYWKMIGGRFERHDTRRVFTVKCVDPNHPITRLFKNMTVYDEDFAHRFHPDSPVHVLATRDNDVPSVWVRDYGKGRVYINALGHDLNTWSQRDFVLLNLRAVYWAAKRTLPEDSSLKWVFQLPKALRSTKTKP